MKKAMFFAALLVLALIAFSALPVYAQPTPKDVVVVNPSDNPVLTEPAYVRQPFQNQVNGSLVDGDKTKSISFTVPTGSILVIETISGQALVGLSQNVEYFSVGTRVSGTYTTYELILLDQRIDTGGLTLQKSYFGTERVRIYADPETNVSVAFQRDTTDGDAFFFMAVSGYLVPVGSSSLAP